MALGGKPYGISPIMLLELTSLEKTKIWKQANHILTSPNKSSRTQNTQLLTVASNSVDYKESLQDNR